jgi:hypothetical protein
LYRVYLAMCRSLLYIMHTTTSVSRWLNVLSTMFKVIAFLIITLYARFICEELHFTHRWKARVWPHHFTASHLLSTVFTIYICRNVPHDDDEDGMYLFVSNETRSV